MNAARIILVFTVGLLGIGLGTIGRADELIVAICILASAVMLCGYFVFPGRKMLTFTIPSVHEQTPEESAGLREVFRFLGRPLPMGETRIVQLRLRRRGLERLWRAIAAGILVALWNRRSFDPAHNVLGSFTGELSALFCVIWILNPAFRWFAECHLLNDSSAVFTYNYSFAGTSFYSGTKYTFIDQDGNYRGGESRLVPSEWREGELALIFFAKKNPDRNRANFGFHYYTVEWAGAEGAAAAANTQ